MVRMFVGIVLSIVFTALWCFVLAKFYEKERFVSAETRAEIAKTLQVTPDQRTELNRSVRICDEFAFGLLGLLVGGVIGGCCGRAANTAVALKGAGIGAILGLVTGAAGGYFGHAFQANVQLSDNSTVHSVLRLIAMFLPFAIAVGFAAALSGSLKRDAMDTIVGAILGLLIAATVYGLLSDANPSTRETESNILPFYVRNQAMLMGVLATTMCLLICSQTLRSKPKAAGEDTAGSAAA